MERSEIESKVIDPEIIRDDPFHQKFHRAGLFKHAIDEMIRSGGKRHARVNIHELKEAMYDVGDNPIVFKRTPKLFSEFGDIDLLIALSSKRIYSSTQNELVDLTSANAIIYNAAVIHQSLNYVACGNYKALENSIKFYNEMVKRGVGSKMKEQAFESFRNNNI